jgi:two-component system sensor histidine kinase CreC
MSRRFRIFLGIFAVFFAVVGFLLYRVVVDLDPRYRESAEESLVDTANLLATLLERRAYEGIIPTDELERTLRHLESRPVYARIFDIEKTRVDLHVYVTDRTGVVLFDSRGKDVGNDFIAWRDVWLTLEGSYGARTTLADPADPGSGVMYVGAAIRERDGRSDPTGLDSGADIVGMVAVGKPVAAFRPFIASARDKLLLFGALAVVAFAGLVLLATVWVVRPFGLIQDVWRAMGSDRAAGGGSLLAFGRRLAAALRAAFADARDTLAGRSYADEYVQTLAHELKSPLAAIRGAAELLREPMPEDTRAKFTSNIEEQVGRASDLIERLLELSGLERRGALQAVEPVALGQLAARVRDELLATAARKQVTLNLAVPEHLTVSGDPFLLQRAAANLVRNAIEFSPAGGAVDIDADESRAQVELRVRDRGRGLPDFARGRVFDKFYSLPRPDTGRKGTGLGLAFVREVAQLHGGTVRLANHPDGGALATLTLPRPATR